MPLNKKPNFKKSATAFIDILGFTQLIEKCEKKNTQSIHAFQSLLEKIETHVNFDNKLIGHDVPPEAIPKYIFVSDSIILTSPLKIKKGGKDYFGLTTVLMKSINLAHKLIDMGFLVRGGISVGPVYSYEKNIFGSGYINAYLTEQKANNPKILLTRDAKKHYEKAILPRLGQNLGLVRQDGDDLIADMVSKRPEAPRGRARNRASGRAYGVVARRAVAP